MVLRLADSSAWRRTPAAVAATLTLSALALSGCGQSTSQSGSSPTPAASSPAASQPASSAATPSAAASATPAPTTEPPAPTPAPGQGDQNGSGENGSGDNGSGDNGSGDNGSGDNGSGDNGSGDNGSGDGDSGNGSGSNGSGNGSSSGSNGSSNGRSGSSRAGRALMSEGASGDRVAELQARLAQLNWFSGKVTGYYGTQTAAAVSGFQGKRGLPVTGTVDQATWDQLVSMTKAPNAQQPTGGAAILSQGQQSDRVAELQARLAQLDWFSGKVTGYYGTQTAAAVSGFQGKRGLPVTGTVDQATWDQLVAMTHQPSAGELTSGSGSKSSAGIDPRCMTGRVICISKGENELRWVVDGKVLMSMDVRFGTEQNPTREGQFSVNFKSRDHVSTLYHTAMPYAMFFSGGQAVHYSADFAARGYRGGSHGCVNVRDKGAVQSLFNQVRSGDKVIVYS